MPLQIASRRAAPATLAARYPGAVVLDLTSRGPQPWVRFSPFYPHGGIPIPFAEGETGMSVEGIWQGLKVFEQADVDPSTWAQAGMRGLKRTQRRFAAVLGHRAGPQGASLLAYGEARQLIYLPTYRWVLEHRLADLLAQLQALAATQTVVLLDYETNGEVADLSRPLSHAALVKHYLDGTWPE